MFGIEINKKAAEQLSIFLTKDYVFNGSILDFDITRKHDLALIKGVLIHIQPEILNAVYEKLYNISNTYILIAEYYNPTPVAVKYRGYSERLFKRDFAGEMLDKFSDLKLIDYGFCYGRDITFPQDDVTWILLKKN